MLAIIIVSWNVRDLLDRCITTVHASLAGSGIAYRIVVVDNASTDGTSAMLRTRHPDIDVIDAGRNLGFAGANNLALRRVFVQSGASVRYVLLLNPDTEVVGGRFRRWRAIWRDIPMLQWRVRGCVTLTERCSRAGDVSRRQGSCSGRARRSNGAGPTTPGCGATAAWICWMTGNRRSIGWSGRH